MSPSAGFDLTTLVVIGTDCIGSCKSYYHTTMTAPETVMIRIHEFILSTYTVSYCIWYMVFSTEQHNFMQVNVLHQLRFPNVSRLYTLLATAYGIHCTLLFFHNRTQFYANQRCPSSRPSYPS